MSDGVTTKALPTSTPTVTGCLNTFSNNSAATSNNDTYGVTKDLTAACPAAPVPTLNGWGTALLGLLMAGLGSLGGLRRRRRKG